MRIATRDLGPMGAGSNMFRTGLAHSSGAVFLGTYGPQPAIIWKYDPARPGPLQRIGAPGEYQLDSMVEAPNGRVYIGTAYNGVIYELDPETGKITDLGPPPVESTPWIFALMRAKDGEIFGARGVGLFRIDWRTGAMESLGIVPGEHETPGVSSAPVTRYLAQRPDGLIWGDTNRWIFTFDPRNGKIEPVADIATIDPACYGVMHTLGPLPHNDLYFQIYARFNDRTPEHMLYVCRAGSGRIEPMDVPGVEGHCWPLGWHTDSATGEPRWMIARYDEDTAESVVMLVDVQRRRVAERWSVPGHDTPPFAMAGRPGWSFSSAPGSLYRAEPENRRLVKVASNPTPVECRCLAASPDGRLGADTYDCGAVFTRPISGDQEPISHGRVWFDDHRANYGPAAFAGVEGRYFLANHGEDIRVARLWATDVRTNRHHRLAEHAALQLVRITDGRVAGTLGPNPPVLDFDPTKCWTPSWVARPGPAFVYEPGETRVRMLPTLETAGPIAAWRNGRVLVAIASRLLVYDLASQRVEREIPLPASAIAAASDPTRDRAYVLLEGGAAQVLAGDEPRIAARVPFGPSGRGFFVVPSGSLVGIAHDGGITVLRPGDTQPGTTEGPAPLPAGPAVDPRDDAWYFAHRSVTRYELGS